MDLSQMKRRKEAKKASEFGEGKSASGDGGISPKLA